MNLQQKIKVEVEEACNHLFTPPPQQLQVQPTNPEFEGAYTLICFPLAKQYKKKPDAIAQLVGDYLTTHSDTIVNYNVVKGFLNLSVANTAWLDTFWGIVECQNFGTDKPTGREIIIEFSSPNTNKPLHLGHLRNNFLGASVSALYEAVGYKVHKVQIINDRGIHICKSMVAWKKTGNGETPQSSGVKGDKLIGKYYVAFNTIHNQQVTDLMKTRGLDKTRAEKQTPIMQEAIGLLKQWEQKDEDAVALWKTMNDWVYAGFEATYRRMGVSFDKLYFESETYLLGKQEVLRGLEKGVFFKKEDGSMWVDLTDEGLDEKVLLRSDGTSVYITQDIGTAILRYRHFPNIKGQIYTVGNEQEYHFRVLFLILAKLGYAWATACHHLSYGMVDLPSGRMKSREGTVVDADDLMDEMVKEAKKQTHELGKIQGMCPDESHRLFETIGIGALKYYLLKVDPRKRIIFNPEESIQLQGHTGPFIQYTYARIRSVLRKAVEQGVPQNINSRAAIDLTPVEISLIQLLTEYPEKLREAAAEYAPAVVANYVYDLAKAYNKLYQSLTILGEKNDDKLKFRTALSRQTGEVIKKAMGILQIEVPERM